MLATISATQLLLIYTWFMAAIVIFILMLIARFYQNVSGENTHYWAFLIPIIMFGIASARNAFIDQVNGDLLADSMWFLGGCVLVGLCVILYRQMTTGR
jgi:hypothetical protein